MSALAAAVFAAAAGKPRAGTKGKAKAAVAAKAKAKAAAGPGVRRRSRIDLDEDVDAARAVAKQAKKVLRSNLVEAKAAEKKKMRLTAKASKLASDDLHRIALYKRIGLVNSARKSDVEGTLTQVLQSLDDPRLEELLLQEMNTRKARRQAQAAAAGTGLVDAPPRTR